MLCIIAATLCALALASGLLAVGKGTHFTYKIKDIWEGRQSAWLYIWVTGSTIFSLAHFVVLVDYGRENHWMYSNARTPTWMLLHSGMSLLLTSAHFFIKRKLHVVGDETYLWGPHAE